MGGTATNDQLGDGHPKKLEKGEKGLEKGEKLTTNTTNMTIITAL